ncbi:MAG: hypothetical protein U1F83_12485 [Verrucomicrobiota bacterium]
MSTRRLEARFMLWRVKPWYRSLSKLIRFDLLDHYATKADLLQKSLTESGYLIGLSFYRPVSVDPTFGPRTRMLLVRPGSVGYYIPTTQARLQYAQLWDSRYSITLICRNGDAAYWQQFFCTITNRVRWGYLRNLGGDREDIDCHLPDGEVADLDTCQKWLNESVAAGWMVGVCASNRVLIASRRKLVE